MSIKPSQKQLEFLSWEVGVFFHFGIRTFFEGHKCIGTFPQTYAKQFKLTIDEAEEGYKLNTIKLFMA